MARAYPAAKAVEGEADGNLRGSFVIVMTPTLRDQAAHR